MQIDKSQCEMSEGGAEGVTRVNTLAVFNKPDVSFFDVSLSSSSTHCPVVL